MAENTDSLIVGSEFDPSGFAAGLARSLDQYDRFGEAIASRAVVIPSPQFDPREFTADVLGAAQRARDDLADIIDVRGLSAEASAAAQGMATSLETTLLERVGRLRERLAAEDISPEAFQRQAQLAVEAFNQEMGQLANNLPAVSEALAAPIVPTFDARPFIQEIIAASDVARQDLLRSFDAQGLSAEARAAGAASADALQSSLLGQLGGMQDVIAAELISPAAFRQQADAALQQYSLAVESLASNPPRMPPPVFDASAFTQEVIAAADVMRESFSTIVDSRELSAEAAQAANAVVNTMQTELLGRLGDLKVELANEMISPAEFVRQGDAALEAFSREVATRARTMTPVPLRVQIQPARDNIITDDDLRQAEQFAGAMGNLGSRGGANAMQDLENRVKDVRGAMAAGSITNAEYKASLEAIRQEAIAMREQGLVEGSRSLTGFNRVMDATQGRVKEGAVAMRQMRLGAAQLAVQSLGTTGALGQLAQGMLIFGGGSALVVGVGLGIAAIASLYNNLTDSARKAHEEQQKLFDQAQQRVQGPDTEGLNAQAAAAAQRVNDMARSRVELERQIGIYGTLTTNGMIRQAALAYVIRQEAAARVIADQLGLQVQQELFLVEATRALQAGKDRQAQQAALTDYANSVGAALQAGTRIAESTQLVNGLLRQQLAIADNTNNTLEVRQRAQSAYNALVAGITATFERQVQLAQQAGQAQLTLVQRLSARAEQIDAPITVRADVSQAETALAGLRDEYTQQIARLQQLEQLYHRDQQAVKQWAAQRTALEQLRNSIDDVMHAAGGRELAQAEGNLQRLMDGVRGLSDQQAEVAIPVHLDTTPAFAELEAVQRLLAQRLAVFQANDVQPPEELVQAFTAISQEIRDAIQAPITALIRSAGLVNDRLQTVRALSDEVAQATVQDTGTAETIGAVSDRLRAMEPLVQSLQQRYALVTAEIEREGGPLKANIGLLQTQQQLMQQLAQIQPPTPLEVTQLEPLQQAAAAFVAAQQQLEIAAGSGVRGAVTTAQADLDVAKHRMDQIRSSILETLTRMGVSGAVATRIVQGIADAYEQVDRRIESAHEHQTRLVQDLADGISVAGQFAQALGLIGETGEQAFNAVSNLFSNAASGNLMGVLGTIAGLGGPNPTEREHLQLLQQNSDRLRELSQSIVLLNPKLQGSAGLGAARRETQGLLAGGVESDIQNRLAIKQSNEAITREVEQRAERFGLTLQQLNDIAKANNLPEILDKQGNIVLGALTQLDQALDLTAQQVTAFGVTFDEQLRLTQLRSRIEGQDQSPAATFAREEAVVASRSPVVAQAFAGVDLKNEAAVRAATKTLLDLAESGQLTAESLGLTHDEFIQFISDSADYLDSFNKGLQDATDRINDFNLPEGFRREALAFQNANLGPPTPPPAIPPPQVETRPLAGGPAPQLDTTGTGERGTPGVVVQQLHLTIDAGQQDPNALFDMFVEKLRSLGLQQTGDTMQINIH